MYPKARGDKLKLWTRRGLEIRALNLCDDHLTLTRFFRPLLRLAGLD